MKLFFNIDANYPNAIIITLNTEIDGFIKPISKKIIKMTYEPDNHSTAFPINKLIDIHMIENIVHNISEGLLSCYRGRPITEVLLQELNNDFDKVWIRQFGNPEDLHQFE